jgi:hypothetical protein
MLKSNRCITPTRSNPVVAFATLLAGATLALTGCMAELDMNESYDESELGGEFQTEFVSSEWAFAWSNQETGSFNATSSFARNSSGDVFGIGVTTPVTQLATGQYRVRFPGIGTALGGHVQVTAYGSGSERCKVQSWTNLGGAVDVMVGCFTADGAAANSLFSVAYLRKSGTGAAQSAYVWADSPTAASYAPDAFYQFNSTGAQNTIVRQSEGQYAVTLPGLTASGGTVEVTAYGTNSDYCKVASFSSSGGNAVVNVRCYDTTGTLSDGRFTLNFARETQPNGALSYSYAWANNSSSTAYTPSLTYQHGVIAGDLGEVSTATTAGRTSEGRYFVNLPGMSSTGSNVQITAYGSGSEYCKVAGWQGTEINVQASVACFDASGAPADTLFLIVYTDDKFVVL